MLFVLVCAAVALAQDLTAEQALDQAHRVWHEEGQLLKARYNDARLSPREREAARRLRRENVMTRRYGGRGARRAMALSDALMPADAADAKAYYDGLRRATGKQIVSAAGYSGQGYQNADEAARMVARNLPGANPSSRFILHGGVTPDGIGKIGYDLADNLGMRTTGTVSSNVLKYPDGIRPRSMTHQNMIIKDASWGGFNQATGKLNPTSDVFVHASDKYVAAGGGEVMADEAKAMMQTKGADSVDVAKLQNNVAKTDAKYAKNYEKWVTGGKQGPPPVKPQYFGNAEEVIALQKEYRAATAACGVRGPLSVGASCDMQKVQSLRQKLQAKMAQLRAHLPGFRGPVLSEAQLALQQAARDRSAGLLHTEWRADYIRQNGANAQRWKPVKANDAEWFAKNMKDGKLPSWARQLPDGGIEVDIAHAAIGSDVSKLPAGIKASNLDSSETAMKFARRELAKRGIMNPTAADIAALKRDPKFMRAMGDHIHKRWLSQNSWARSDFGMDRSFRHLAAAEARKDISVGAKALDSLETALGGTPGNTEALVDDAMRGFKDVSAQKSVTNRYKARNTARSTYDDFAKGAQNAYNRVASSQFGKSTSAAASSVYKGGSTALKATGRVLTKAMVPLAAVMAGHSIIESRKDVHQWQDNMDNGIFNHTAARDAILGHTTDLLLGKGGTVAIGKLIHGGTKKAIENLKNCKGRMLECSHNGLKATGRGVVKATQWTGKMMHKGGKAAANCALNPLECSKKIGAGFKKLGSAVGNWWDEKRQYYKERAAKEAAELEKCQREGNCEELERERKQNRSKAWKSFRTSAWNWITGKDDDEEKSTISPEADKAYE